MVQVLNCWFHVQVLAKGEEYIIELFFNDLQWPLHPLSQSSFKCIYVLKKSSKCKLRTATINNWTRWTGPIGWAPVSPYAVRGIRTLGSNRGRVNKVALKKKVYLLLISHLLCITRIEKSAARWAVVSNGDLSYFFIRWWRHHVTESYAGQN